MKKLFFILSIVFILASCDDKPMKEEKNPFIGTWEANNGYRTVYTVTNVTTYRPSGDIYWTGTYTYNATHITVQLDQEVSAQEMVEAWGISRMIQYRFEGEIFYFNNVRLEKVIGA